MGEDVQSLGTDKGDAVEVRERRVRQPMLLGQLRWIVRLRWVAGLGVMSGGLAARLWLHWYGDSGWWVAGMGVLILTYNGLFWWLVSEGRGRAKKVWSRGRLYVLAWAQILVDLVCLTALVVWTGGDESPLRGFFVFHMVFASLLLPRVMAFGAAMVAIGLVEGTLSATAVGPRDVKQILGWAVTMLATVYLASRVAQSLWRTGRRLSRQNRRIRAMSERLRQQQQALAHQEKMVAMGQMAAGVAHEVANPLASMDGLLQLLERRPEKMSPENMARLREQIARVNQIVRQLTTFAHPSEGEWQEANLNDVVTRALEVLRFDSRFKEVTVEKSLDPRVPKMWLQPVALEQVVINIAMNAADAMEGGAVRKLGVRTEVAGEDVRLMISDTGHGISPEVRERIFDPFFTTKPVGKGTGLGLSISYSLIRKHGGDIGVESTAGKGTVFTIRLRGAPQRREGVGAGFVTPEKSRVK